MPVAAVRAGNVVLPGQRFANAHRNRFLADVQMREARHQRARVQFIHLLFEQADAHHLPVQPQPELRLHPCFCFRWIGDRLHAFTPDICAKTSKTTAKSFSTSPLPRAAVRNSLVTAVVGMGTSSCRPSSNARSMSFCIMFTLNHASSGIFRMN